MQNHVIFHCSSQECGFRFPFQPERQPMTTCPRCGSENFSIEPNYDSIKVNKSSPALTQQVIEVVLENIRSAFNVGSIFRTSDSAGIAALHLCGMTPTPENLKVAKTALGSEFSLPWQYYPNSLEIIQQRRDQGFQILALEGGDDATPLQDVVFTLSDKPILLIIGSEVSGLDPKILSLCNAIISIPMLGFKDSLNVAVAYGIAAYFLRYFPRANST